MKNLFVAFCVIILQLINSELLGQCTANFTHNYSSINCGPVNVSFTNTSTVAPTLTYTWDFGNSGTFTGFNPPTQTYDPKGGGTHPYTITLTVSDTSGCSSTHTEMIQVKRRPEADLEEDLDFRPCEATSSIFVDDNSTAGGGATYTIDWGHGTPSTYNSPPSLETHTYPNGIFTLVYTIDNNNGCSDVATYQVGNISSPAVGASLPSGVDGCGPKSVNLNVIDFSSNDPSTIYTVSFGDTLNQIDTFTHAQLLQDSIIEHYYQTSSCPVSANGFPVRVEAISICGNKPFETNVKIYIPPQAGITANIIGCVNQSVSFQNATIAGYNSICNSNSFFYWDFGDGTNSGLTNSDNPQSHIYAVADNYTATLLAWNSCDTTIATFDVTIVEPLTSSGQTFTLDGVTGQTSDCSPSELSLQANVTGDFVTYNWHITNNNGFDSTRIDENPTLNLLEPGTYTINFTANNVCTPTPNISWSETITITSPPVITPIPPPGGCGSATINDPSTLFNIDPAGGTISNTVWDFGNGTPASHTGPNPPAVTFPAGSHTVSITVTNECDPTTRSVSFTIGDAPAANATEDSGQQGGCIINNQPVMLNYTNASQHSSSYNWSVQPIAPANSSGVTITDPTTANQQITFSSPGRYVVRLTASNVTCGDDTWEDTVTIATTPTITTSTISSYCDSVTLSDIATYFNVNDGGAAISSYDWTFTGGTPNSFNGAIPPDVTFGVGQKTITLTTTNNCNSATESINFEVIQSLTTIDAGPDTAVCLNDPILDLNLSANPNTGGNWSGVGITPNGMFNPMIAGVDSHTISITISTNGCDASDSRVITVKPLPNIVTGGNETICEDIIADTLTGFSPANGTWSGSGILTGGQPVFYPDSAQIGANTLTLQYTDPTTGCSNSATKQVTVAELPIVNAGMDTLTLCNSNNDIILSDYTSYTPSNSLWMGTGIVNPTGIFNTITAGGTGVYCITMSYADANNCNNQDTLCLRVIDAIVAEAGMDEEICLNEGIQTLTGFAPTSGGTWSGIPFIDEATGTYDPLVVGAGTYTVTYSFGGAECLTTDTKTLIIHDTTVTAGITQTACVNELPFMLTGANPSGGTWSGVGIIDGTAGLFNPAIGADTYEITYTYINVATGCEGVATKTVIIHDLPTPDFSVTDETCVQTDITFTNNSSNTVSYDWNFGDGDASILINPIHSYSDSGSYEITLIATSIHSCKDTIQDSIYVTRPPVAAFIKDTTEGCAIFEVNFTNQSYGSEVSYLWDFGNDSTSTLQQPPTIPFAQTDLDTTTYHIRLTVTNSCGDDIAEDSIRVYARPIVDFGTNVDDGCTPLPIFIANITTGNTQTYSWDFGNGNTWNDSIAPTQYYLTGNTDSVYYITLIAGNDCGIDTVIKPIVVKPNPVESFFFTDTTSGCAPLTVNFSDFSTNGTFITWNMGDSNSYADTRTVTHTFDSAGTYTVYQYVNNGCGYDTSSIEITVFPKPTVSFAHDYSVCAGTSIIFTNTSPAIASSYWTFDTLEISDLTSPSFIFENAGTYAITLRGLSTTNGCPADTTSQVIVLPNPTAAFTTTPTNGCEPLTVNFTNQSTGNFHTWNFGDGNTASDLGPTHQFTGDSTYFIRLETTDINGCKDDTTISLVVHEAVVADFSYLVQDTCGVPVGVNFTNLSSPHAIDFEWRIDGIQQSTANAPVLSFNQANTFNVTLIAASTFGCADTINQQLTIYDYPMVDIVANTLQGCAPLSVDFANQSTGTAHQWTIDDSIQMDMTNLNYTFIDTGWHEIHFKTIDTIGGCMSDTVMQVYVSPAVVADFATSVAADCGIPVPITTNNQTIHATAYEWQFDNYAIATAPDTTVIFPDAGTFTIRLIADNPFQCPDTAYQSVTIYDYPTVAIVPDTTIGCIDLPVSFTNNSSGTQHIWDFGNGDSAWITEPSTLYTTIGTFAVRYTSIDSVSGCTTDTTLTITTGPKAIADFLPVLDNACQVPAMATFYNQAAGSSSYFWNIAGLDTSTLQDATWTFTTPNTYDVTLIVSNAFGCSDTITKPVTPRTQPIVNFELVNTQGCPPLTVEINNLSEHVNDFYWTFGDGTFSTDSLPPSITYDNTSTSEEVFFQITLAANMDSVCFDLETSQTIRVYPAPEADFYYEQLGGGRIGFHESGDGITNVLWDFGDGHFSSAQDTIHRYYSTDTFEVQLLGTNLYGCQDSTSQFIMADLPGRLYVPNAFYPLSDLEKVNVFKPDGVELTEYQLVIYSKWGQLIYDSNDHMPSLSPEGRPLAVWDGRDDNGKLMPQGAYVWKIYARFKDGRVWKGQAPVKGGKVRPQGTVTLIR